MKKIIVVFLALALCMCGCGVKEVFSPSEEEIVLPPIPTPMPAQTQPAMHQNSEDLETEDLQASDPAEKTYAWEEKFNPTGYTVLHEEFDGGRAISWIKDYKNGRSIVYYDDGAIEDLYYYPSGSWSHGYFWSADGSYSELRWLDNGDVETMPDGTKISHLGTLFYSKTIHADGSWEETQFNSEECALFYICQHADGRFQEIRYYENGNFSKSNTDDPVAGTYQEETYYENGQLMRTTYENSQTGEYSEFEYFDDGKIKCNKFQTPEKEEEKRYDEEGFLTYFHTKNADYEIEMHTDENGKLVQVVENGQTIEDPTTLAQYVTDYNFRS